MKFLLIAGLLVFETLAVLVGAWQLLGLLSGSSGLFAAIKVAVLGVAVLIWWGAGHLRRNIRAQSASSTPSL